MHKHPLAQMLIIGLIAGGLGLFGALSIDWFPPVASTQATKIDRLFHVLLIASVPIFVLVIVVVLYSVWKFRHKAHHELTDGQAKHGHTGLEMFWTAVPLVLIISLVIYAVIVLGDMEETQAGAMQVNVTAQQFAWSFSYPQPGGKPVVSNQLYLEKDRPVQFNISSKDVVHDFWVPAFRAKIDAVPGITTKLNITPTKLGEFEVVCSELCGLGHAVMRQSVHVLTPPEFDKWLAEAKAPPKRRPGLTPVQLGREVFLSPQAGCGACHKLGDAGTTGTVGPDLDQVLPGKSKAFIEESIVDPEAQTTRGFSQGVMPNDFGQRLSPQEIDGLVDYLARTTR
jgi:cytochrome c oxidase subunit 2